MILSGEMTDDLDKYYQAHTLSRVRGVVFNFQRKNRESRKLKGGIYGNDVCLQSERNKIDAFKANPSQPYLVLLHPTHGQPGSLAYRVQIALERHINKTMESGLEATSTELLRMIGLKPNIKRRAELDVALDQLQYTFVEYHSRAFFKTRKNIQDRFSFISYSVDKSKKTPVYRIQVHSTISSELLDKRKFQVYNFNRIAHLEPFTQCFALCVLDALTRRKIKHDKSSATGAWHYNKAYNAICSQWLGGLSPRPTHSRAWSDHLKARISALVDCGILHSDSHLSKSANAPTEDLPFNANVLLYPGEGFLQDHDRLHPKKASIENENKEMSEQVDQIIAVFNQSYLYDRQPHESDRRGAAYWIEEYGFEKAKQFVGWAAQQANNSNYSDLKYITGLKTFRKKYEELAKPAALPGQTDKYTEEELRQYNSYLEKFYQGIESRLTEQEKTDYQTWREMLNNSCPNPKLPEFKTFAHRESLNHATSTSPLPESAFIAKLRRNTEPTK